MKCSVCNYVRKTSHLPSDLNALDRALGTSCLAVSCLMNASVCNWGPDMGKQRPLAVRGQNAFKKRAKTPGVVEGPSIPLSWELIWHFYQRQGQCLWSLKNCRKLWAHPNYVNSKSIKNVIWIILGILNIRGGYIQHKGGRLSACGSEELSQKERKREREG